MGVFDQGGGGGRSPLFPANDNYALDKPYDLTGEPDSDKMQQIDEMLQYLFRAATKNRDATLTAGSGDVVGPEGATDGFIATFDGTTGKLIQDGGAGGQTIAQVIAASTGIWNTAEIILTESILEGLFVTPLVLVAPQGVGTLILAQSLSVTVDQTDAYNAVTWNFAYTGSVVAGPFSAITADLNNIRQKCFYRAAPTEYGVFTNLGASGVHGVGGNLAAMENAGIEMSASADPGTAGHANGVITITYRVIDLPAV